MFILVLTNTNSNSASTTGLSNLTVTDTLKRQHVLATVSTKHLSNLIRDTRQADCDGKIHCSNYRSISDEPKLNQRALA